MICAICTSATGPFTREPLGRDNALVNVCAACTDEPAREKRGPDLPYEIQDGMSREQMSANIGRYAATRSNATFHKGAPIMSRPRTPGWLLVRAPIRYKGVARDSQTAARMFADEPWANELHVLGSTRTHHLFERPDPRVAAASRARSENPLALLEPYRSGK